MVKSISLGGLTILVLIRVIQANLVKHKVSDKLLTKHHS